MSNDGETLDWPNRGSQRLRIVAALVEPDCLVRGRDSECERSRKIRINRKNGRGEERMELEGSLLYAARFGPVRAFSTCVEPNPACPSRECLLYMSYNRVDWKSFSVHEWDGYHPHSFACGAIVLLYA